MKHLAAIMVMLIFTCFPAASALGSAETNPKNDRLTLAAAKHLALENNPGLTSAKERVLQARQLVIQAKAARLPAIDYTGSWHHRHDNSDGLDNNQYASSLSASLTLFDGFLKTYTVLAARWDETISRESLAEAKSLLVWSTATAYLNVQLAMAAITIAESDILYNQRLAQEARIKRDAGTGSLSDLLNFETRVNSAQAALITARNDYDGARFGLAALLGFPGADLPTGMTLEPLAVNPDEVMIPSAMEPLMAQALERRPDLRQATLSVEVSETRIRSARSGFYPTVALTGSYGSSGPWESVSEDNGYNGSIGLTLSMNLFSGGATTSKVRQAQSRKRESEKNMEQVRLNVMADVRSAMTALTSAKEQLLLQKKNTVLLARSRDLVEEEYRAGQTSLTRLNEAQNTLVTSRANLARANAALVLALEQLHYATGTNLDGVVIDAATPSMMMAP